MKVGILLSGSGVYDGSEIQETVVTLLTLEQHNIEYVGISIDKNQHHVVNHLTGAEENETRNMLEESARIMRGNCIDITSVDLNSIEGLVIPGGFGNAKNFSNWALTSENKTIIPEIKHLLESILHAKKPIVSLCVSPILISLALKNSTLTPKLTLGSTSVESPYSILDFHKEIELNGSQSEEHTSDEICYDEALKIISAPCYMHDVSLNVVYQNIQKAIDKLVEVIK
jgi:enhancing lycopene biosynthesis protein 2